MTGSGSLYLSGTNTYTGGTTVSGGELIVTSPEAIDASGVGTNLFVGNDLGQFGTISPASAGTPAGAASPPCLSRARWSSCWPRAWAYPWHVDDLSSRAIEARSVSEEPRAYPKTDRRVASSEAKTHQLFIGSRWVFGGLDRILRGYG